VPGITLQHDGGVCRASSASFIVRIEQVSMTARATTFITARAESHGIELSREAGAIEHAIVKLRLLAPLGGRLRWP